MESWRQQLVDAAAEEENVEELSWVKRVTPEKSESELEEEITHNRGDVINAPLVGFQI